MIELTKLIMANPLQGIVAAICVCTLTLYLTLGKVQVAVAVINEQQAEDKRVNALVFSMNETLIRIDENLIHMNENLKIVKEEQNRLLRK